MVGSFASIAFSNASSVQWAGPGLMKISVDAHQTMTRRSQLCLALKSRMSCRNASASSRLVLPGLDVLPLEPLHVVLIEHGRHRLDVLEEIGDRIEMLVAVEHAGVDVRRHRRRPAPGPRRRRRGPSDPSGARTPG